MSGRIIKVELDDKDDENDDDDWIPEGHKGEVVRCPYCQRRFMRK
jgi:hypothetical protein